MCLTRACAAARRRPVLRAAASASGLALRAARACRPRRRRAPANAPCVQQDVPGEGASEHGSERTRRCVSDARSEQRPIRGVPAARAYPLTPPMAKPPMMYFCRKMYTSETGRANRIAKALNSAHGVVVAN